MGFDPNPQARRRQFLKVTGGAITTVGIAGCTGGGGGNQAGGNSGGSTTGSGGSGGSTSSGGGGSESLSFDDIVSKAKDEGKVTVFATASGAEPVDKAFEDQYGIKVDRSRQGSKEVANRIIQGNTAKSQRVDLGGMTSVPFLGKLGDANALAKPPKAIADKLDGVTIWHQNQTVAEAFVKRNLLWLHNGDLSNPPKTWKQLVSGDYVISINNEDPQMLLVYEEAFGKDEAQNMIKQVGKVGTITTSHGSAGKGTAKGEYDVGDLMYKFMSESWGKNLYWQPKTYKGKDIPMSATVSYVVKPKKSPHPNAGWLYFQWLCENQASVMQSGHKVDRTADKAGNVPLEKTWYSPSEGHSAFKKDPNVKLVTYDMGPKLVDRLSVWKNLLGVKSA